MPLRKALFYLLLTFYLSFGNEFFRILSDLGLLGITAFSVYYPYKEKDKEGFIQLSKVYLSTATLTYGLKYSIKSKRPDGGEHSFPSGHASLSFAGAYFVYKRYDKFYGSFALAGATFVGLSRIIAKKHYFRDVLAGAVIGIGANLIFTTTYGKGKLTLSLKYSF